MIENSNNKYSKKITKDGSLTLFNEEFKEHYHSLIGAKTEAISKYLKPYLSYIDNNLKSLTILDPFFGLGFNTFAFINYYLSHQKNITTHCVEIDKNLSSYWNTSFLEFNELKKQYSDFNHLKQENFFSLLIGDTLKIVDNLNLNQYDIILHDAFSFYKCPELWCVDLFSKYYHLLREGGVVLTYSSSKIVRAGLLNAGFSVYSTPPVEKKQGGTISIKWNKKSDTKILEDFKNICHTPYKDNSLTNIQQRRCQIIEEQRNEK